MASHHSEPWAQLSKAQRKTPKQAISVEKNHYLQETSEQKYKAMQKQMPPKHPGGVAVAVADMTFFLWMHLLSLECSWFVGHFLLPLTI